MLSSYFLARQARQAEDRLWEIQAIRLESENRRERAEPRLLQEQTRRAETAEAKVKILQAQLELTCRSRRHRRNRLRLRDALHRRLCCTNCAKSL